MSLIRKTELLKAYNAAQTTLLAEDGERRFSENKLGELARAFSPSTRYDIFLSHSYQDARVVRQIRNMLVERGFTVYVDWIEDSVMGRSKVTKATAEIIKKRLKSSASLIYLTSNAAEKSVWMPWELGYMDAHTGRVAVAPILEEQETEFSGREYLALYPYLDLTNNAFYIHSDSSSWVQLKMWMTGANPERHL